MNHKPQSLSSLPWLVAAAGFMSSLSAVALGMSAGFADEVKPPAAPAAATTQEPPVPSEGAAEDVAGKSGDELLSQVREKLESLDSLTCDLHQTAMISGMKLIALGRYSEASGNRVHLQYRIFPLVNSKAVDAQSLAFDAEPPAVDESTNRGVLTQVSDGDVLYTSWKNGDTVRITRRNIREILAAALAAPNYVPKNAAMDLGIGGLRGLISRLQTAMEFAPVKSVVMGERNFFEVTGRWNQRVRSDVFKISEDTVVIPQPYVPEYVRVFVDAQTLLPRRIQYLKRSLDATQKNVRPMITLDLRNLVLNEQLDDQLFVFHAPEDTPEEDLTEQVIQAIQQAGNPPTGEALPGAVSSGVDQKPVPPTAAKKK